MRNICNPIVVGGGWSFWLQKTVPEGNIVFLNMTGEKTENVWFAGTKLKDVIETLKVRGLTLSGIPSIDDITLGSWVFSQSHGTGGSLWVPSISNVTVYDWTTQQIKTVSKKRYFNSTYSIEEQRRYVILEVEIIPIKNELCKTVVFDIHSEEETSRFFFEESYLRAIFVSSNASICILWCPTTEQESYFSLIPLWLWTSVPLVFNNARWYLLYPKHLFSKVQLLSSAHMFVSSGPVPLFSTLFSYMFTNFEVFVETNATPRKLFEFCKKLEELFRKKIKGRCEIRGSTKKLFLDFAVKTKDIESIFNLIHDVLGGSLSLHKGKVQVTY